jgi:hypothetical protein
LEYFINFRRHGPSPHLNYTGSSSKNSRTAVEILILGEINPLGVV